MTALQVHPNQKSVRTAMPSGRFLQFRFSPDARLTGRRTRQDHSVV